MDVCLLSSAQERLWMTALLQGGAAAYNVPVAVRVRGAFRIEVFERVLQALVQRHEVLRTTYLNTEDGPRQVVGEQGEIPLRLTDLSTVAPPGREVEAAQLLRRAAAQPIDLQRGPIAHCTVVRLGEQDHLVQVVVHHIACDASSLAILIAEVRHLYAAFAAGTRPSLPDLPVQYADYAAWERHWMGGDEAERHIEYWRTQLSGAAVVALPVDRSAHDRSPFEAGRVELTVSEETTRALKAVGLESRATLFMTLLAGFQVWLSRECFQDDIVVGMPTVSRPRPELDRVIGCFLNTVVFRTRVRGHATFRRVVEDVRDTALQALAHQPVPLDEVFKALPVDRDGSRHPFLDVLFSMQTMPREPFAQDGLEWSPVETANGGARAALELWSAEVNGGIRGFFEYETARFEPSTIERMGRRFVAFIETLAAHPDASIADLVSRHGESSPPGLESADTSLCRAIEQRAVQQPDAEALVCDGERLTYADLPGRVQQIAGWLRARGVRAESPVVVLTDRPADMVLGILGALKAGGVCIPLDARTPAGQLASILREQATATVLTRRELCARLPADYANVVLLDEPDLVSEPVSDDPPLEALAYLAYPSSAGHHPGAFGLTHAALAGLASEFGREAGLGGRSLQLSSLTWHARVVHILAAWIVGGSVHVAPLASRSDEQEILYSIHEQEIAVLVVASPMLDRIARLASGCDGLLSTLRGIVTPGAPAAIGRATRTLLQQLPECRHHTLYTVAGIELPIAFATRSAADATSSETSEEAVTFPDAHLDVVGREFEQLGAGSLGELCVRGAVADHGWFGDAARNATDLVPDPLVPSARVYRTRDLCRYREDGSIDWLSRGDDRIFIRGRLVSLEAVRRALLDDPDIGEALVHITTDGHVTELIAHIVAIDPEMLDTSALSRRLNRRLPAGLVPTVVAVPYLPVNWDGSIDGLSLAPPESQPAPAQPTPVELLLRQIWADVLERVPSEISVQDRFFSLGGHSLNATQVVGRIARELGIEPGLAEMFRNPSLRELASTITEYLGGAEAAHEKALARLE